MYTSLFLALVGAPGDAAAPSWQTYAQASQMVEKEKKPLAVFLGTGRKGWEKVAGSLGSEAERVLAASYLCAYVDTNTPEGKKLAQAFELTGGVGVVLSDSQGQNQVFWHDGNLPQDVLVRQLVRHSISVRTSMYQTDGNVARTSVFLQSNSGSS